MRAVAECPRCGTELARARGPDGIAWTCASCGGHAVAVAVLRKTARMDAANRIWQDARLTAPAGALACPWCAGAMGRVGVGAIGAEAEIDVCAKCQFVWFDAAEAERVPARARPTPERLSPAAAQAAMIFEVHERQAQVVDAPDEGTSLAAASGLPTEHGLPEHERRAWVTWALTAVAFAATLAVTGDWLLFLGVGDDSPARLAWGFQPSHAWRHGGLTLLTAFAVHATLFHLAVNLYFLLLFGDDVENRLGPLRHLGLVAAATMAGNAFHAATTSQPHAVVLGASGAVCGVAVYYALAFSEARLQFGLFLGRSPPAIRGGATWLTVRARVVVALYLALETALAAGGLPDGVSHASHVGGAAVGLVAYLVGRRLRWSHP